MANYRIEIDWRGSEWGIYLWRHTFWKSVGTIIKSAYAKTEKDRDEIVEKFKLNKDAYIKEYEDKIKQNKSIYI